MKLCGNSVTDCVWMNYNNVAWRGKSTLIESHWHCLFLTSQWRCKHEKQATHTLPQAIKPTMCLMEVQSNWRSRNHFHFLQSHPPSSHIIKSEQRRAAWGWNALPSLRSLLLLRALPLFPHSSPPHFLQTVAGRKLTRSRHVNLTGWRYCGHMKASQPMMQCCTLCPHVGLTGFTPGNKGFLPDAKSNSFEREGNPSSRCKCP